MNKFGSKKIRLEPIGLCPTMVDISDMVRLDHTNNPSKDEYYTIVTMKDESTLKVSNKYNQLSKALDLADQIENDECDRCGECCDECECRY